MEIAYISKSLKEIDSNLRNSLTGILGSAQLLEQSSLDTKQQEFVKDILSSGYSILKRIEQIEKLSVEEKTAKIFRNHRV